MNQHTRKMYQKALLMAVLTGAIIGVSYAGYDATDESPADSVTNNENAETRELHAKMLIQTLSEEFTEIEALASQQVKFREMGDSESIAIARMYGTWIRDHKAGVPALAYVIRLHGGDPEDAKELKPPVLGTKDEMLMATHMDHEAAITSSQMRYGATDDWMIKELMNKRANTARKHLAEMADYHQM